MLQLFMIVDHFGLRRGEKMRSIFLAVFLFVCVGITAIDAGRWSKWYDLTICSAKPCQCEGYKHYCDYGKKVMIRSCLYEEGDTSVCQYEGRFGSIKFIHDCKNKRVCPGWSDWIPREQCHCKKNTQILIRTCSNPSPIHPDVLCWDENKGEGATEQRKKISCNCTEEERKTWYTTPVIITTTTTTPEPNTQLPWCCEQVIDVYYDYNDTIDYQDPTTTTTSKPKSTKKPSALDQDYYDYYDSFIAKLPPVDCTPCTAEYGYTNATGCGADYGADCGADNGADYGNDGGNDDDGGDVFG